MAQFIQNTNRDAKTKEQEALERELKAATDSILGEMNCHNVSITKMSSLGKGRNFKDNSNAI